MTQNLTPTVLTGVSRASTAAPYGDGRHAAVKWRVIPWKAVASGERSFRLATLRKNEVVLRVISVVKTADLTKEEGDFGLKIGWASGGTDFLAAHTAPTASTTVPLISDADDKAIHLLTELTSGFGYVLIETFIP